MSLLSTFTTNSFNILAGINGSEVSQALVIAVSVIVNDLLYLPWPIDFRIPLHLGSKAEVEFGGVWNAGMAHGSKELVQRHLFSLYFMLPMVAVCSGFLYHNWYAVLPWKTCTDLDKVSGARIPWRHFVLCYWNGICRGWYSSALFQDSALVLYPPDIQLSPLVTTTAGSSPESTASGSAVRSRHEPPALF